MAYFAPVYFETGIDSLAKGCPGYDPNYEPFDKDSVNFVIGAITAGAGTLSSYIQNKDLDILKLSRSGWSVGRNAALLLPPTQV